MGYVTETTYSEPPGASGPKKRMNMWHWLTNGKNPCEDCRNKNNQIFTTRPSQHLKCECFIYPMPMECTFVGSRESIVSEEYVYEESTVIDAGRSANISRTGSLTIGDSDTDTQSVNDKIEAEYLNEGMRLMAAREIANSTSIQKSVTASGGETKAFQIDNTTAEPMAVYDEYLVKKYQTIERWVCGYFQTETTRVIEKTVKEWIGPTNDPVGRANSRLHNSELDGVLRDNRDQLDQSIQRHLDRMKAKASQPAPR